MLVMAGMIIMLLAGIMMLCKDSFNVNSTQQVSGAPIKVLGVLLIFCSALLLYPISVGWGSSIWIVFVALGLPFMYTILITFFCAHPIEDQVE